MKKQFRIFTQVVLTLALVAAMSAPCPALDRNRDVSNEISLAKTGFAHVEAARFDDARSCFDIAMRAGQDSGNSYLQGLARLGNGMIYFNRAKFAAALDELDNAVELLKPATKKQRPALARAYIFIARTQLALSQFDAVSPALDSAYQIVATGVPNRERAEVMQLTAEFILAFGYREQAKTLLIKTLDERTNLPGRTHPDVAATDLALGKVLELERRYDDARGYYMDAARIYETAYGKDNPATARAYSALGGLASLIGDFPAAAIFLQRAMDVQEKTLGRTHPDYAQTSSELAAMYLATGMSENARNAIDHAIYVDTLAFGENSLAIARDLAISGEIFRENMTLHKAEEAQRRALEIYSSAFGENNPALADTLDSLAVTLYYSADWEEALEIQQRALELEMNTTVVGAADNDGFIAAFNNLGALAHTMGDPAQAVAHYLQAIQLEKLATDGHPLRLASINHNLALAYLKLKDDRKARDAFNESLKLMRWNIGPDNQYVADEYLAVAECSLRLGDFDNAEKEYKNFLRLIATSDKRAANVIETLKSINRWYDPEPSPKSYLELRKPQN